MTQEELQQAQDAIRDQMNEGWAEMVRQLLVKWAAIVLIMIWIGGVANARPIKAPQIYLGIQNVAPVTVPKQNVAVTALALWPLPKRASVQVQFIQPIPAARPLLRVAFDVRVR